MGQPAKRVKAQAINRQQLSSPSTQNTWACKSMASYRDLNTLTMYVHVYGFGVQLIHILPKSILVNIYFSLIQFELRCNALDSSLKRAHQ